MSPGRRHGCHRPHGCRNDRPSTGAIGPTGPANYRAGIVSVNPDRAGMTRVSLALPLGPLDPGEQHGAPAAPFERLEAMGSRAEEHEVVGGAPAP